jgi:hypothetical protein
MTKRMLENKAKKIPSMNWQTLKNRLREYASKVESGQSIVEVGTWLGACTAHMMLGILDSGNDVNIHMYDRFITYQSQVAKAAAEGVELQEGKEYLTLVKSNIDLFEVPYFVNMGNNKTSTYDGKRKIGLFVDDASKKRDAFQHSINTFQPHFIPGKTIVALLDYWYFEKKPSKGYECQFNYMNKNERYEYIGRIENEDGQKSSEAFFLFKG